MPNSRSETSHKQRTLFKQYLDGKSDLTKVTEIRPGFFEIERRSRASLTVALVDIYTVSESDVVELISANPGLSAIVTASVWNGVTPQAEAAGKSADVGVYTWREFMRAVHHV